MVANSAAFSPQDIGPLPDDKEHYIVFHRGTTVAYRCSNKPVEIKKTPLKEGVTFLLKTRNVQTRQLGEDGLRKIAYRMLKVLSEGETRLQRLKKSVDVEGLRRIALNRSPVESISYMARTFFDAELLILPAEL